MAMATVYRRMEAVKNESDERTYGYYPSARDIKVLQRRKEASAAGKSFKNLHKSLSGIPHSARFSAGNHLHTKLTLKNPPIPATCQSLDSNTVPRYSSISHKENHHPVSSSAQGVPAQTNRRENWDAMSKSAPAQRKSFFLTDLQLPHLENRGSGFYCSDSHRTRHHFICPEWTSEGMVSKRLRIENRTNPLRYGWI